MTKRTNNRTPNQAQSRQAQNPATQKTVTKKAATKKTVKKTASKKIASKKTATKRVVKPTKQEPTNQAPAHQEVTNQAPTNQEAGSGPVYALHHRYMKDSSFENPGAPTSANITDPAINIAVNIAASGNGTLYEVTLGYRIEATKDAKILFLADVLYAGLFEITGVDTAQLHRFIYAEAPRQLYPHAAKILIDAVRDGGLPDLTLEEPDFLALWKLRGTHADPSALSLPAATFDTAFPSAN